MTMNATKAEVLTEDPTMKVMVDRFLNWKLPQSFQPDCGISFNPHPGTWPIGTNVFTATEARQMLEHVVGAELTSLRASRDEADKKLAFLKSKGITVDYMKTSDQPEPYLAYVIASGSELDNIDTVNQLVEAQVALGKLKTDHASSLAEIKRLEGERDAALASSSGMREALEWFKSLDGMSARYYHVADAALFRVSALAQVSAPAPAPAKELVEAAEAAREWFVGTVNRPDWTEEKKRVADRFRSALSQASSASALSAPGNACLESTRKELTSSLAEIKRLEGERDAVVKAGEEVRNAWNRHKDQPNVVYNLDGKPVIAMSLGIVLDQVEIFCAALAQVSAPAKTHEQGKIERDAARYRWMRNEGLQYIKWEGFTTNTCDIGLDHAIDTAIYAAKTPDAFSPAPSREPAPPDAKEAKGEEAWYTCWLDWSSELSAQCYRFQCKKCGKRHDERSSRGFIPPRACFYCVSPTLTPATPATSEEPCRKCDGAGWVRGHELDNADEATTSDTMTKYACDSCKPAPATSGAGEQYEGVRVWKDCDGDIWIANNAGAWVDYQNSGEIRRQSYPNNISQTIKSLNERFSPYTELHGPERLAVIEKALKLKPDLFGDPKPIPASERIHELEERVSELERGNQTARRFLSSIKLQLDNALAAITGGGR